MQVEEKEKRDDAGEGKRTLSIHPTAMTMTRL